MIEDEELLTLEEAAKRCKIKKELMRTLIKRKQVRVVRIGLRKIRIAPSELRRFWEKEQRKPYVPFRMKRHATNSEKATNNETNGDEGE
jgi:excisionase family DNA binding protein